MARWITILALLSLALASPAAAHLDPVAHGSFAAGFTHPLFGLDHVLAMVVVGVWAALQGGRAVWAVPAAFVGSMVIGFAAALFGVPLPLVEPAILASIVVVGLLAAIALSVPVWVAGALVATFAIFHGHAHGGEMGAAGAFAYGVGFAAATALLHGIGAGVTLAAARALGASNGRLAARAFGGATAAAGLVIAFGA